MERDGTDGSSSLLYRTLSSSASSFKEDESLMMLSNIETLHTLFHGVEPTEEPTVPRQPDILRIQYTNGFNYVMGLYRTLSKTFSGVCSVSSARWFLLTAFVLRQSHPHYTGWKDRRDVILAPTRLLSSTQDSLWVEIENQNEVTPKSNKEDGDAYMRKLVPLVETWLPLEEELRGPTGFFSEWRAVRWELNATKCFGLEHHKNFQVWHHRKELLVETLARTESSEQEKALGSLALFNQYLSSQHNISFTDIDERTFCGDVLETDQKNYHVWLHRSWFVHTFPFLVQPPLWETLLDTYSSSTTNTSAGQSGSNTTPLRDFILQDNWKEYCMDSILPRCGLKQELEYTAGLIKDDCLNNSAWCHRFYLFDHDLISVLLRTSSSYSQASVDNVLKQLSLDEMDYALQWCAYEPCNESSFVHARGIAVVYQAASLRLHIANNIVGMSACLNDSGPITDARHLPEHYSCLREKIPWSVFLGTFSLLRRQLSVLKDIVSPRAEELRRIASARDAETVRLLHRCRSQFLLDNVHQVYAAQYHATFSLLEHIWCCFLTEAERRSVHESLPPEMYTEGTEAAAARVLAVQRMDECVRFFLQHEIEALEVARRLVAEDSIRSKYWKHEINIVMHRDYM